MITRNTSGLIFILSILLTGCNEKEVESMLPADFKNGVFITNEGNFGEGDGSLSFYDFEEDKIYNDVYAKSNGDKLLGDVVQSITDVSDLEGMIFVIINNSNKVEALLPNTLESYYTIEDLKLPRYMVSQTKLYVSEWVSFSDQGRVSVIDPTSGETLNTITTGFGSEGMIIVDNKLFVSNNFSTTVSVIDLTSEQVIETLEVGNSPGLMVSDAEGDIWLICAGGYDQDFNPLDDGKLVEIDPGSISIKKEIDLGLNASTKIATDSSKEIIYYLAGTSLYSLQTDEIQKNAQPLISNNDAVGFYGLAVDGSGMIYVSDSKGFIENGEVFVYDPAGELVNNFIVGRGPNGFLFK